MLSAWLASAPADEYCDVVQTGALLCTPVGRSDRKAQGSHTHQRHSRTAERRNIILEIERKFLQGCGDKAACQRSTQAMMHREKAGKQHENHGVQEGRPKDSSEYFVSPTGSWSTAEWAVARAAFLDEWSNDVQFAESKHAGAGRRAEERAGERPRPEMVSADEDDVPPAPPPSPIPQSVTNCAQLGAISRDSGCTDGKTEEGRTQLRVRREPVPDLQIDCLLMEDGAEEEAPVDTGAPANSTYVYTPRDLCLLRQRLRHLVELADEPEHVAEAD